MNMRTIPIASIKRAAYNPRKELKPTDPEFQRLKKSIDRFGTVEPLVWNKRTGNLVGGHQRLTILEHDGAKKVDVSVVDLPDREEKALNLALNKQGGIWDLEKLGELLGELKTGDFDIEITGFSDNDLRDLVMPDFIAGDASGQGHLDRKEEIECPQCHCKFTR
jgi:ParB-like chromosome segregation protein Spo0J